MASGTSQSKILETINAVEGIQKQLADVVKALNLLASKVEVLEARHTTPDSPRGK
jgi:hypothetical protein